MRTAWTLAVVAAVLLAGCGAGGPSTATRTTGAGTSTAPDTPTATPTPTATATATPAPSYDNPWNERVVTVEVVGTERDVRPLVKRALSYWEANAAPETAYNEVEFRLVDSARTADVQVRVTEILRCGGTVDSAVGCAPLPGDDGRHRGQVDVRVAPGYTDASTVSILKHEFGHTLGLGHTSKLPFMTAANELRTLPQTDAANRTNPWGQSGIAVYVDRSAVPAGLNDTVVEQMTHVFTYFNNGGEGATPPNVTLTRTDSRAEADVVIELVRNDEIENRDYANGWWYGTNPDTDERLETVTNATVRVAYNVNRADGYIGWATGYYVAAALQASYDDLPPPWSDEDVTYRDEWWTRA